jgi:hypothetical protein
MLEDLVAAMVAPTLLTVRPRFFAQKMEERFVKQCCVLAADEAVTKKTSTVARRRT